MTAGVFGLVRPSGASAGRTVAATGLCVDAETSADVLSWAFHEDRAVREARTDGVGGLRKLTGAKRREAACSRP